MQGKVKQIHQRILRSIRSGKYVDKIPTEAELCRHFKASRGTVRAAIKELIDRDCLIAKRGSGVYIDHSKHFGKEQNLIALIEGNALNCFYCGLSLLMQSSIIRTVFQYRDFFISLDEMITMSDFTETVPDVMPDGVIWINPALNYIEKLCDLNIPTVALWSIGHVEKSKRMQASGYPAGISGVFVDLYQEGYQYAMHCIDNGFDKLLVVKDKQNNMAIDSYFVKGVESALRKNNVDYRKKLKYLDCNDITGAIIRRALKQDFRGIYCTETKFNLLQEFLDNMKLQYNKDYCLVTRSKSPLQSMKQIRNCSFMDFPHEEMAAKAVELLRKRIASPDAETEQILFPPKHISCNEELKTYKN